jgi:hypothetical protein
MAGSNMNFSKDVVREMIATYGKEQAVNELGGGMPFMDRSVSR